MTTTTFVPAIGAVIWESGEWENVAATIAIDARPRQCYYKRRQASGAVRVYFRVPGVAGSVTIDVVPPGETKFSYGEWVTLDFSKNPVEIRTVPAP